MMKMKPMARNQNDMLLRRGNAMSGAPIIIGTIQLPRPPIKAGMTNQKIISNPWAVMMAFPFIAVGDDGVVRVHQLLAHDDGERAADAGADDRHGDVERADVLVVGAHQPAADERPLWWPRAHHARRARHVPRGRGRDRAS